jgi:hypothetical protein
LANLSISLEGIEIALSGLGYKENSKKFKVISAINSYYESEDSIVNVVSIDTDTLIKKVWFYIQYHRLQVHFRNISIILCHLIMVKH